jgi:ribonucleotide reductase beta subunit family protein with ferritin-like domain
MYADYIEHQGGDENSIISAEHIDVLTFNRIDFEKLSEMQKRIIGRVHSRLTAFEEENADMISSYLKSYSINGTSGELNLWKILIKETVNKPNTKSAIYYFQFDRQ